MSIYDAPVAGGLAIAAVAVGGMAIRDVGSNQPLGVDQVWHDLLAQHRAPAFDAIAYALNAVGGTLWSTVITLAIVLLLLLRQRWRAAGAIAVSVALASGLSSLLKVMFGRPRPADGLVEMGSDSFPSGHATTAAALAVTLALLLRLVWVWAAASVWFVAMALSRTYLLVHWLSDVVGGIVLGASVAVIVVGCSRFLKEPSPNHPAFAAQTPAGTTTVGA